uniref:Nanos-type domain-containing protein n=1 Tax=viral metagenome TaxID=1070528 RepID=A0A6C0HUA2_9ZZZZ
MSFKSTSNKRPFVKNCKFCKDAGKSYEIYTSHFVRESTDPNSKIVCPTILAMECRFCFKKGHTISKCAKYANRGTSVTNAPIKKNKNEVNTNNYKKNTFDLLSDFEDEVSEVSTQVSVVSENSSNNGKVSYADMLKKEPVVDIQYSNTQEKVISEFKSLFKCKRVITNWADDFDSDEE